VFRRYGFSVPKEDSLMDWQAFALTIRLALIVAGLLVVIGLPIAYWITYSRWRWKFLAEASGRVTDCLTADRAGFLCAGCPWRAQSSGREWQALTGHTLAFTFEGLVIGSLYIACHLRCSLLPHRLRRLIPSLWRIRYSRRIEIRNIPARNSPIIGIGLVTGIALSFAHTMGEFGVVLMVGGNIPGVTRTVSIDIYDQVQASNYVSRTKPR